MPPEKKLDSTQVQKLATLSRLTVSPGDEAKIAHEITSILTYIDKLKELDVTDVPPTSHAVNLPTKLREDIVQPSLSADAALKNAPERIGDGFGVPKIIE